MNNKAAKIRLQKQLHAHGAAGSATDTQTIPFSVTEVDAAGQNVPVDAANISYSIDNPAIATITTNADGTGSAKALSVGTANITATDSSNGLSDTSVLTVTAGPAGALVLTFGTAA